MTGSRSQASNPLRLSSLVLLLATLAFLIAPSVTPPFRGYDPGLFPVAITRPAIQPAGYAFAIWGLIYLWLIAHAGFGLWARHDDPAWRRTRLPLTGAVLLGSVWLAIAQNHPIIATIAILAMAALALTAFLRAPTQPDRWLLSAPLAIFAGWLTAAATVSVGLVMAGYGVMSNTGTALTLLVVVAVLAMWVQSRKPAMPVYGATVVWALLGIVAANWTDLKSVAIAALIGAVILVGITFVMARRQALTARSVIAP